MILTPFAPLRNTSGQFRGFWSVILNMLTGWTWVSMWIMRERENSAMTSRFRSQMWRRKSAQRNLCRCFKLKKAALKHRSQDFSSWPERLALAINDGCHSNIPAPFRWFALWKPDTQAEQDRKHSCNCSHVNYCIRWIYFRIQFGIICNAKWELAYEGAKGKKNKSAVCLSVYLTDVDLSNF